MNMNLTLLGQAISFAIFVWFCVKFVWPPILKALEERETRIEPLLKSEFSAGVQRALERIPPADQTVLRLRYVETRSADQITRVLGCAKRTVHHRLTQAAVRFRLELVRTGVVEARKELT